MTGEREGSDLSLERVSSESDEAEGEGEAAGERAGEEDLSSGMSSREESEKRRGEHTLLRESGGFAGEDKEEEEEDKEDEEDEEEEDEALFDPFLFFAGVFLSEEGLSSSSDSETRPSTLCSTREEGERNSRRGRHRLVQS